VCADLRGYGDSSKPRGKPDHTNYSFRRMAQDQVEVMEHLGFREFFVAGHDRGARTAFRMALDHPDRVRKFASIDIIPTHWQLTRMTWKYAAYSYHWFFLSQPYDFPEQLLAGNEEYYMRKKFAKQGEGKISDETMQEYLRCCTPEQIHGVCSDYRATLAVDFPMDTADFEAGRFQPVGGDGPLQVAQRRKAEGVGQALGRVDGDDQDLAAEPGGGHRRRCRRHRGLPHPPGAAEDGDGLRRQEPVEPARRPGGTPRHGLSAPGGHSPSSSPRESATMRVTRIPWARMNSSGR